MRIDGRKTEQNFYNKSSGKRIYCHKVNGLYNVGINGESYHKNRLNKLSAEYYINTLISIDIKTYK